MLFFLLILSNNLLGYDQQLIPGIGPEKFCIREKRPDCSDEFSIYINNLYSYTELVSLNFEDSGFCTPEKPVKSPDLGQSTFGDNLRPLSKKIKFGTDVECQEICSEKSYKKGDLTKLANVIMGSFQHEWIVDNIPVLVCSSEDKNADCSTHFFVGCTTKQGKKSFPICEFSDKISSGQYILFNRMNIKVIYRESKEHLDVAEIMQIILTPESLEKCTDSPANNFVSFSDDTENLNVVFTYSVHFIKNNDLKIENRYDYIYKITENGNVRWLSILVSIIIVTLLSIMAGYLLVRAVKSDIMRYTELLNTGFDSRDEYGWKLLKGDIFRSPKYRLLLSASVGSGIQIAFMAITTLFFAWIGFFSTQARGSMVTCLVVLYVLLGIVSGFVSARIYKFFDGEYWKTCVIATALLHPGLIFSAILIINFIIRGLSSGPSMSFLTLFELFSIWAFVSIPLTFAGSIYGFKWRAIKSPVKKNMIPRSIPRQPYQVNVVPSILIGGFVAFLSIYLQLFFIVKSIWHRLSYVMFGLLFCVSLIFILVCAEVSIIFCYFHLCSEDYRWQWRSFLTSAFVAIYCLIYIIFYHFNFAAMTSLGTFVFFSYSLVMLYMLLLAAGAIGFLSSFYVLLKMFASIKVE